MGLDVEAGRRARLVADIEDERWEGVLRLYPGESLFAERADGLPEGVYECAGHLRFRAGSYSGYNRFRDRLARLAHGVSAETIWNARAEYRGSAFYEVIDFSDCEGAIGPQTSRKLAADFAEWRERAAEAWSSGEPHDDYDLRTYDLFARAFALAADEGAVQFC